MKKRNTEEGEREEWLENNYEEEGQRIWAKFVQ